MKCPYCSGENCVDEYIIKLYISSIKRFISRKNTPFEGAPSVGEVGNCKKTGDKIWYCPHCNTLIKSFNSEKIIIKCSNCNKEITLPATNRTVC